MRKKQYKCITVHKDVYDKINKLSQICNLPKSAIVARLATPVFEVASIYENCQIESFPLLTRGEIIFQVFNGTNPRLIFGKLTQPINEITGMD